MHLQLLFGSRLLLRVRIWRVGITRRGLAGHIWKSDDALAGKIRVDDDAALFLEVAKQTTGTASGMGAVCTRDAGIRGTWFAANGRLGEHQENALEVVGHA